MRLNEVAAELMRKGFGREPGSLIRFAYFLEQLMGRTFQEEVADKEARHDLGGSRIAICLMRKRESETTALCA
jgi:hypothetical protein